MNKLFPSYRVRLLFVAIIISLVPGQTVFSQHEGHNMPGMSKSKAKKKVARKKKPARVGFMPAGRNTSATCHGSGKNRL